MDKHPFFIFQEHSSQTNCEDIALFDTLYDGNKEYGFSSNNAKYLNIDESLQAGYLIGMRWIEWDRADKKRKGILWVKPKHKRIPFEKILYQCLKTPVVTNHLEECYKIFLDEPSILVPSDFEDFLTPLLISDFLLRVQKIVRKGLKKNFITVVNPLSNRIKGKIIIKNSQRLQQKKNVITQTVCSYQIHTTDCLENRILKAALLQAKKYIYRFMSDNQDIKNILYYNLVAFEEVQTTTINPNDFNSVNNNSFFKEYQKTLLLEKPLKVTTFGR